MMCIDVGVNDINQLCCRWHVSLMALTISINPIGDVIYQYILREPTYINIVGDCIVVDSIC